MVRRVPGGITGARLEGDAAVANRHEVVFRDRAAAKADRGACPIPQLEMTSDEIRVEMREEDVRDAETPLRSERQVLIDVTLRIDDGRRAGRLVGDEIRRVGQAVQVELPEDHARSGCGVTRRYGFFVVNPFGNFFFASSSDTEGTMMTSSPCFQSAGVDTE
jgi:hypothetical protein